MLSEDRGRIDGPPAPLPWIGVAPGAPYFVDEDGTPWTPVGQNDSIAWLELDGLFRRRDLAGVDAHLARLAAGGVTCLRLMLECAQSRHRYLERPVGRFVPAMVRLWDDLFALCERHGLRILLTPFDTFWTWLHWRHHPYHRTHGGPLARPSRLLTCPEARAAIKARLTFAVERWGGSGALFAWDLWNEIHPAHSEERVDGWAEVIADLGAHVRALETRLYGRAHLQTVSLFGPELWWRPHLDLAGPIFRHPDLDFATIHIYRQGTIDDPADTVAPALDMGRIVGECLAEIRDGRPFLDTEHGPIHRFKDRRRTLPEAFDDEYFRHMQWAHLASGGAGGGMRWPNRHPHALTAGMRQAQAGLSRFLPLIDWTRFRRRNVGAEIAVEGQAAGCCCADGSQAVAWLVRRDRTGGDGRVAPGAPAPVGLTVPGLAAGEYELTLWDTRQGRARSRQVLPHEGGRGLTLSLELETDLALTLRRR